MVLTARLTTSQFDYLFFFSLVTASVSNLYLDAYGKLILL